MNFSSAVLAKWTKLNVKTCFYGNYELCILTNHVRKSESLREIIFPFQGTNFVCCDATNWRSPVRNEKQEPYKLCRSKPWHNETTSSGWEYKHLSTASTALLVARSKRNRTFTLHYARCLHCINFTAEICKTVLVDSRNDMYTWSTNVGSVTILSRIFVTIETLLWNGAIRWKRKLQKLANFNKLT